MKLARPVGLVLVCGALAEAGPELAVPQAHLSLPASCGALSFSDGVTDVSLDELLRQLARLTGQELAMTKQTRELLRQDREPLESVAPVPREEVYAFVEGLLAP